MDMIHFYASALDVRRVQSRRLVVVAFAVLTLTIAGCSSAAPTAPTTPAAEVGASPATVIDTSSTTPTATTPSPVPVTQQRGTLMMSCNRDSGQTGAFDSGWSVAQYPAGTVVARAKDTYTTPLGSAAVICGPQSVSPDLKQITARVEAQDGTTHVGWVNLTTGTFFDVTAANTQTGFSATPETDITGVFDPATGDFWFLSRTGAVHQCAPGKTTCTAVATVTDQVSELTVNNGFWRVNGGGFFSPYPMNPSHTLIVSPYFDAIDNANQRAWTPNHTAQATPGGDLHFAIALNGKDETQFVPLAWANDTDLLMQNGDNGDNSVCLVRGLSSGTNGRVNATVVVPASSRTISNVTASPDGTSIAFAATISDKGTKKYALYSASLGAEVGSEPTQIAILDGTPRYILGYRP